ncbi:MAG: hypothetical protein VX519_11195, partial [Myxococcota bacterium]|nr:hypothetical protein [Myxococcota bacterium]
MTTWFIGAVLALAPLEEIRIETPDGSEISGVISAIKPDAVVVHEGAGKHTRVEFAQMTAVE